jgi:hypothetical protein
MESDGISSYPRGRLWPLNAGDANLSYTDLSKISGLSFGYGFRGALFDGSRVWILPHTANMFIRVDTTTNVVSTLTPPLVGLFSGAFDGRSIWMAPYVATQFLRVDTITNNMTTWGASELSTSYTLPSRAFVSAAFDGELIWYIPYFADQWLTLNATQDFEATVGPSALQWPSAGGQVLTWDANMFVRIDVTTDTLSTLKPPIVGYYSGAFDGRRIWMAPYAATQFLRVDTITDNMTTWGTLIDCCSSIVGLMRFQVAISSLRLLSNALGHFGKQK